MEIVTHSELKNIQAESCSEAMLTANDWMRDNNIIATQLIAFVESGVWNVMIAYNIKENLNADMTQNVKSQMPSSDRLYKETRPTIHS